MQRLSDERIQAVLDMLADGVSALQVSKRLEISYTTVSRIKFGELKPSRAEDRKLLIDSPMPGSRCPGCGAIIFVWPCVGCRANEAIAKKKKREAENVDRRLPDGHGEGG